MPLYLQEISRTDLTVDLSAVSGDSFGSYTPLLSTISWGWNSGSITGNNIKFPEAYTINSYISAVTGDYFRFTTTDDTADYIISAIATNIDIVSSAQYNFYPQQLYISALSISSSKVDLLVVLNDFNGTVTSIPAVSTLTWDSTPKDNLLARFENQPVSGGPSSFPISGTANETRYLYLTSTTTGLIYYQVDCSFDDPSRTVATFQFSADGSARDLLIKEIASTDYSISLSGVLFKSYTSFIIPAASSIQWSVSPSATTTIDVIKTGGTRSPFATSGPASEYDTVTLSYTGLNTTYTILLSTGQLTANYTYTPELEPTAMAVVSLDFDNLPYTRSLTAQAMGYRDNIGYHKIGSEYSIVWEASGLDTDFIRAYNPNTDLPYTFGTSGGAGMIDTLIFKLTTNKFTSNPNLCSVLLSAAYIQTEYTVDGDISATSIPLGSSLLVTVDEFPADSLFNVNFKISNEDTHYVNDMWRLTGVAYIYDTWDTSNISNVVTGYTRVWDWGNTHYDTSTGPSSVYTFYSLTTQTSTVIMTAVGVSAAGWLSAHSKSNNIDFNFVPSWLSANFIAYPNYVWSTSALYLNVDGDRTLSPGVCAYGEGHTEKYYLSAGTDDATSYSWIIGNNTRTGKTNTINIGSAESETYNPAGTAIMLSVFNDIFPTTMVSSHTGDSGSVELYPNFNITVSSNNSNKFFQNIRMVEYETPTLNIISPSSVIASSTINAIKNISWPSYSPVTEQTGSTYGWRLSAPNWTLFDSDEDGQFTLTVGDGVTPGTIIADIPNSLNLLVTGNVNMKIDSWPGDWDTSTKYVSGDLDITAYNRPDIRIFVTNRTVITGQPIEIQNATRSTPAGTISAFIFDDGQGNIYNKYDFSSVTFTYSAVGTYDISVTAIGSSWSKIFADYITVISDYTLFDSNITRIYGAVDLELPKTLHEVQIPPNEWTVADNIQAAINKLNTNLTYLDNSSKVYGPSPTNYFGWLGSTIIGATTSFNWHISGNNSDYNDTSSIIPDTFTELNDIVVENDRIYVANDTSVSILSSCYNATQIGSTLSQKAIGDSFIKVKSIAVDSTGDVFILDSPKNRIVKFSFNENRSNNWKLLVDWGGLGGQSAKTKFNNPNEIKIYNDFVYVVDKDNDCIKKYTNSGSWVQTYTNSNINKPLSVAVDNDFSIHILTNNYVVKLSQDGTYIDKYTYEGNGNIPKKIITGRDGGFMYICLSDRILKVTTNGEYAGTFAVDTNALNYIGCYHDEYRNFYIASDYSILWYSDLIYIFDLKSDTENYIWPISACYINKDEYVQDWVYNYGYARFWDNLEVFRRSIYGKPTLTETQEGVSALSIRDITSDELLTFNYNKSSIYIGVNEFNTADVVNRAIYQLYNCQEILLEILS